MGCDWCTRMDATVHQQDTPCRTQSLISPATGCVSQGGSTVESFPRNFHLPTGTVSSKGSPHLNICWFRGSKVWPPCRISGLKFSAPLQLAKALSATVSLFSFFLLSILAFSFSHRKWKWSRSIVSDSLQPYGLPYSSIHTIFQARVLEWVAISFSRGSSRPRDPTQVSRIVGRRFTVWATREALTVVKSNCTQISTSASVSWRTQQRQRCEDHTPYSLYFSFTYSLHNICYFMTFSSQIPGGRMLLSFPLCKW